MKAILKMDPQNYLKVTLSKNKEDSKCNKRGRPPAATTTGLKKVKINKISKRQKYFKPVKLPKMT